MTARRLVDRRIDHVVLDLHGTLIGPPGPVGGNGAALVVRRLRERGLGVHVTTNSSTTSAEEASALLRGIGVVIPADHIASAGHAMALYLNERHPRARVFVVGQGRFRRLLRALCDKEIEWSSARDAGVVVVGRNPQLGARQLDEMRALSPNAVLLATSADAGVPGQPAAAAPFATVRAVERVLGRRATIIGKPNPFMVERILRLHDADLRRTVMVGDSYDEDVTLAYNAGAYAIHIRPPRETSPPAAMPYAAIDALSDLPSALGI